MLFPSFSFLFVFLPLTLAGAWLLARQRDGLALGWIAAASLVFYAAWSVPFTLLLVGSVVSNFLAGGWLARHRGGRPAAIGLAAAVAANLALLGYFKYANFFLSTVGAATIPGIVLPLGISFFTFTQIAFLVDVHRGVAREYRFGHYLLFVTYYPHLIAGPLLHHGQVMPQFARAGAFRFDAANVGVGLSIFAIGLAKKVLVADPIAQFATPVFDAVHAGGTPRLFESWMGALAYTLQLYFDFSGYSDMAIGLSLMLNVRMPLNFDSPYKAASIIEFWRRWHMTLSSFLRDYLYIPLGGNRRGRVRRYFNLMVTMLLGGLWHGAAWTFVAWGALHGAYLAANHAWRHLLARLGWRCEGPAWRVAGIAVTFLAVVAGWVVFRADSLGSAGSLLAGMAGLHGASLPVDAPAALREWATRAPGGAIVFEGLAPLTFTDGRAAIAAIAAGLAAVWVLPNAHRVFARFSPAWEDIARRASLAPAPAPAGGPGFGLAIALGVVLCLCVLRMGASPSSEFLYFQF